PPDPGDEDDRDAGIEPANLPIDLHPGLVGQARVEDDHIGPVGKDVPEPSRPGAGDLHPMAGWRERSAQLLRHQGRAFVDEKEVGSGATTGRLPASCTDRPMAVRRRMDRLAGRGRLRHTLLPDGYCLGPAPCTPHAGVCLTAWLTR